MPQIRGKIKFMTYQNLPDDDVLNDEEEKEGGVENIPDEEKSEDKDEDVDEDEDFADNI